jgi:putative transposase
MARLLRFTPAGFPQLVLHRAQAQQSVFADDQDYASYFEALAYAAKSNAVDVYAYALVPNQVVLLLSAASRDGVSRMMQTIGRLYVRKFNQKYAKTGSPWEGRFRSCTIDPELRFLDCLRYVESAALRAGLVSTPEQQVWCSYRVHAGVTADKLVSGHPQYWRLGNTPFEREAAYRTLLQEPLAQTMLRDIEQAAMSGRPLGSGAFLAALGELTPFSVQPAKRGRPAKKAANPI